MLAVGIGVLAGVLFGLLTTLVRRGLMRQPNALVGAMVITSSAAVMVLVVTVLTGKGGDLLELRMAAGYFALGIVVPGISQILFVVAVREVGASRTAIMIGTAPLLATIIAVAFRGEALVIGLVAGTVLIVIGGASLAWDRNLPPGFRARGMLFAFFCALLFAVRDNAVRMLDGASEMDPRAATTWTLIGAAVAVAIYATISRRGAVLTEYRSVFRSFIPAGVVFASAYLALVVALEIGRVTVFAPLNAMQSMWTVLFAWLLLGKSDGIGARIVLAMLLVVSGGILIGVFR
ncbi:MAG: DMT family transporter [Thermoleophilia bacterium]